MTDQERFANVTILYLVEANAWSFYMREVSSAAAAVVLIVDDEPLLRMSAVSIIEDAGFIAIEAGDADEAIRLLESRDDIRLVFTDIDMPVGSMNGLKLARAVRDRWPPIAIVIVSGHKVPEKNDMPDGAKFFSKPYDERQLITTFNELLTAA